MKVIWNIETEFDPTDTALTVGTFDGIHLGHKHLLKQVHQRATEKSARSALVTFEPHPQLVLGQRGHAPIKLLTTIEEKTSVLEKIGLDYLVIFQFTDAFASISAEDFVRDVLFAQLRMRHIIIGHDHSFGRARQGNFQMLDQMGNELDFGVEAVQPISLEDEVISSTRVRQLLHEGYVERAAHILDRPYSIRGTVVKGLGRGKELGFPTANLKPDSEHKLVPKAGIYATQVQVGDQWLNSVTYIGGRPTFDLKESVIEIHITDFDENLYGRDLNVVFTHFIRDDARFDSTETLVKQIKDDKKRATELLR